MYFGRTAAIVLRQLYLIRGSFARVAPLFAWVAIDIVLWGFITKYLNSVTAGMNFVPALLGAVLLWDFFNRVMQGVSMAFLEDIWSRNLLNIFATPLRISEFLGGLVISSVLTSSVGLVVMLVLATAVFGLSFVGYGMALIPFLLVLFMFGIALGILAISLVLRLGPAAEWFVWPIPALISPFAGVFYPIATLPEWMQWISRALPPSYVFEGLRSVVNGGRVNGALLTVGAILAIGYIGLASLVFRGVFNRAVRTGLIARFSAENLS